ncbi:PAN2-PAN3 deadenylation complex subunit pan3 isoform X3 [Parasteatoda tepidariorum]|uniref:PAN2-PAN3 deadenylation complex subunit pan3 isoform X3 n=1 Tax=Parasteatoda tepidariorum TaxID=114398 RepID=UPI001C71D7BB|nr:PAN2-PAN3 deadenylation complex subunit pan3 isoform X3 [Parasteatoda tepidariorum]
MEHMFQAFTSTSTVPPESKLQTYLSSMPVEDGASYYPDAAGGNEAIDLSGKEFGNGLLNRMPHSLSSPSFSQFSMQSPQLVSTPFGHFGIAADMNSRLSRCSPQQSPLLSKRTCSPGPSSVASPSHEQYMTPTSSNLIQESVGGTTYFYSQEETSDISPLILPDMHLYPGNPSHIEHMRLKANAPSFFLPDELRMDILHRHQLTLAEANPEQHTDLPAEVDAYHKLCPLEPPIGDSPIKSSTFGYVTSVYKAAHIKTGVYYCMRRIHGFRVSNTKCISIIETWKKLQHSNLVHLREVFTTKAFGDNSMIFVHDYHPGADTLMNLYFNQPSSQVLNGYLPNFCPAEVEGSSKPVLNNLRQHAGLLPESLIWGYIVQLSSVLRSIHAAGLACRAFDPSKILVTGKSRYLLHNQARPRSINDIMPMIGARFYTQLDAAQMRSDVIENELSKEVQNGRLFRILVKLGTITERAELNMDHSWAETGDRYLLKLFRDYLFHQVTEDGRPWVDSAHVIQCLNKLDAGVSDKICLMGRDEQNVLVVTYAELKACFESSFGEILNAAAPKHSSS